MAKINYTNGEIFFSDLVTFSANKYKETHRWYPLVEGYSSEFVRRIIGEQKIKPQTCLDPFGGVGTTPLVCQEFGIKCYAFENSPFFSDVARTKLRNDFDADDFEFYLNKFSDYLAKCNRPRKVPHFPVKTMIKNGVNSRWLFHKSTAGGIFDIIDKITEYESKGIIYSDLFRVAIANFLVDFSNVFRNGKCLSYKSGWEDKEISRKQVHQTFLAYCRDILLIDIRTKALKSNSIHNYHYFYRGDSRELIKGLPDNEIDLIITSPPYLNSRDYTDTYRIELWMLGYVNSYAEERKIRESALTSHVQIQLNNTYCPEIPLLKDYVRFLLSLNGQLWNKNIPKMVMGYFADIENMLIDLKPKLKKGAKLYINVSNSSYGGKVCEVDTIIGKLGQRHGYKCHEIRTVRFIKSSVQQNLPDKLRESIIVLEI